MKDDYDRLKWREEKLRQIHQLGVELVSYTHYEDILKRVSEATLDITEAEEMALFIMEPNSKELRLKAFKKKDVPGASILGTDTFMPISPKKIDKKIDYLELSEKDIATELGYPPGPHFCVSLDVDGEKIGSLCVFNPRKKKTISSDFQDMASLIGACAATTIKNVKEREEAHQKAEALSAIHEVSKSMLKVLDFNKRLEHIAKSAFDVLHADIIVLYVYDEKIEDVNMPPVIFGKQVNVPYRLKEKGPGHAHSVVFRLLERQYPFYAFNAPEDWFEHFFSKMGQKSLEDHFIEREGIISSAGIPLHVEDEPVGVLFVNYRTPQLFNKHQKIRIETFANEAALAIRNARLFSQRQRYLRQLDVLNQVVQEISSSVMLEIPEILDIIYKQAGELLAVEEYFFVAFYNKENDMLSFEYAVVNGEPQETGFGEWASRAGGRGLTEYLMKIVKKEALLLNKDLKKWFKEGEDEVEMIGLEAKCWLGAPMIYKTEVIGVIGMQSSKENAYNDDDKKFLEIIASQAAIAIAEARLFQKSQSQANELYELYEKTRDQAREVRQLNQQYQSQAEELNQLYTISQEIAAKSTSFLPVLNTILEKAVELSKADAGQIYLYDEASGELKMPLTYNSDVLKGLILKKGQGMAGTVLKDREAKFTNDYFNSRYSFAKLDTPEIRKLIKGVLQIPLLWQDKSLGVLSLTSRPDSKRNFSKKDAALLAHFVKPASIAISLAKDISFRQSILNDNPEAIIAINQLGKIIQFNRSSERITGFCREEIINTHIVDFYFDGEAEARRIINMLREQLEKAPQKTVSNIRSAIRGKNGERIPILLTANILQDELSNEVGSIGFMRDLRELKIIDDEYRSEQAFLARIEHVPQETPINNHNDLQNRITKLLEMTLNFCGLDYIILFASTKENDTILKAIAWNNLPDSVTVALPHFNWKKAELLSVAQNSQHMLEGEIKILHGWSPNSAWKQKIFKGIRGGNKNSFEGLSCGVPVRLADNYRAVLIFGPFKDSINLVKRADFILNIGQTININALSWLQALYLRAQAKDAARSSKLIVHRTKVLLQQIMGKFGLIKRRTDKIQDLLKYAGEGEKLSSHLANVATRALFSHIAELEEEDYDFQDYPLPALIQNCAEGFQLPAAEMQKRIVVDQKVENLPYANIDPILLSVALGNLIDNALKYSKEPVIKIYANISAKDVTILVENFGRELREGARANFQKPGQRWPANQVDKQISGTGFGLWDSGVIAAGHGGTLDFSSEKQENSRNFLVKVWITFPLKRDGKI